MGKIQNQSQSTSHLTITFYSHLHSAPQIPKALSTTVLCSTLFPLLLMFLFLVNMQGIGGHSMGFSLGIFFSMAVIGQ